MKPVKNAHSGAAARKRRTPAAKPEAVPPDNGQKLAGFAPLSGRAVDADRWPMHPFVWLQPELLLNLPASGLRVERQNRLPVPEFQEFRFAPAARPYTRLLTPIRAPEISPSVPHSALELLGWEPRAILAGTHGEQAGKDRNR